MIRKLQITFLVIVPLVFIVIGFKFDRTKYSTDPESAYLLNGINIATGKAVGHYDNPGTTVQLYSAVVLRITHFLRSTDDDLQTDVLRNSEYFIEVMRYGLIIINACMLLILGIFTLSLLGNFWLAILLQLAPFLSVTLLEELFTKVAPEPVLFATVSALIMLLLKFYKSNDPGDKKYSFLFAVLSGFGLATKMTFLPILIIPFMVLIGKRNKWIYAISIIPSFILFTLPAVKGYLSMAKWFLNMGTHTGTYGQGSSGIIDPAVYFKSILSIVSNNKSMFIVVLISIAALIFTGSLKQNLKSAFSTRESKMLTALLMAQLASILLVAKHYFNNHYLFPSLSLTGLLIVFILLLFNNSLSEKGKRFLKFVLPATVAVIIGFSLLNIPLMSLAYRGYRESNQSTDATISRLDRDYRDYTKVYYYPSSFNVYSSLRWGNVYSRQYSTDKLMELYPEGLFYNIWEKSFQIWETNISVREFVKKYGGRILLVGGPLTNEELKNVEDGGLKLTSLFDGRIQAVYQIDTAHSEHFKQVVNSSPPVWMVQNDFETISPDGQWFLLPDGSQFCKNSALSTEQARSGKNSVKLPYNDSYAMDFELVAVKAGDVFEATIWRSGGSRDVFLVASAGPTDPFYQQNCRSTETDGKGWQKVTLDFKIPEGFKGTKIKIYLWNHSNHASWFDDFEIKKY